MPFMKWVKTLDGYKPIEITDEEMFAENARRRGKRAEVWLDEANEMVKREKEKKMEFDKSRVYTAVNADELKAGDKVIVADTMTELKVYMSKNIVPVTLTGVLGEEWTGRFDLNGHNFNLAYLVERAENCTNCDMGEMDEDDWIGCSPDKIGKEDVAKTWCCDNWKPKTERAELHLCGDCIFCKNADYHNQGDKFCPKVEHYLHDYHDLKTPHECSYFELKNLCDTCYSCPPDCPATNSDIKFGNGKGNDNVVDCKCYKQKAEPHYRPFTIREAKEYILQNWFDGAENVEASIPVDPEYKAMKIAVEVLELAEKICGVEDV